MNIFALSCIITALFTAIMCVIILLNNIKEKVNRAWFMTCVSVLIWTVGLYGTIVVDNSGNALFWQRILYIGTILAPIYFFYFALSLLKKEKNNKILFVGFIAAVLFLILSFSNLFILGVSERGEFGYWPVETGLLYPIFLIFFFFYVVYSLFLLKTNSRKYNGVYQKQIQYAYYAGLIGFAGASTNFLLDFGVNTYSIGNYCVIFYIIFISFAVFKHHLFNIKVIATELFTFALWITLFIKIFVSDGPKDLILNISILISVVVVGIFLIRSVIKEVEQKEEIKRIGKEIEKAYAVEKLANEELKKLDKYKNDFLRQTQHDLKNPLVVIMGYADLLISGNYGKMSKKGLDIVKKMEEVSQEKLKDVNNFLDEEQFKMGKAVVVLKDKVELSPILEEIVNRLKYQADGKSIYLKLEKPFDVAQGRSQNFLVSADREKLKSALFNIVDNSVKYTEKGGVSIKVEGNPSTSSGQVRIIISDTGIGIPKDRLEGIFKTQFERTKQAKETTSGSGVGLYLSAQIINLHKGKINVESEGEGKGSTFTVELPVSLL